MRAASERGPGRLARLDAALGTIARVLATVGLLGLFANALAVVVDVLLRAVFAAPIDRLSDVSSMIFVVSAACCVPAATASRRHVTIRAFDARISPALRDAIEALAALLATLVFGVICWQVGVYADELRQTGQTLSQIDFQVWPLWYFVTGTLAFTALAQGVVFVDHLWHACAGRERADAAAEGSDGVL